MFLVCFINFILREDFYVIFQKEESLIKFYKFDYLFIIKKKSKI